ncbi:hypothetical protein GCM10014715_63260 [Streptomyces spiralis]|uniref:Uncharacterized protein n=1 Tax=Streptomyces spiralis TaxID=66376 RepID=A0A919ABK8_9ACTN|nr:hypothetical protein [Streptomyces spiralis]GHE98430.1 hypothetical protein GCM10014715_63260 [Streptomyces spiralis]
MRTLSVTKAVKQECRMTGQLFDELSIGGDVFHEGHDLVRDGGNALAQTLFVTDDPGVFGWGHRLRPGQAAVCDTGAAAPDAREGRW